MAAPTGSYRCRILAAERLPVAQDATPWIADAARRGSDEQRCRQRSLGGAGPWQRTVAGGVATSGWAIGGRYRHPTQSLVRTRPAAIGSPR